MRLSHHALCVTSIRDKEVFINSIVSDKIYLSLTMLPDH
jgi:hypothetical protein